MTALPAVNIEPESRKLAEVDDLRRQGENALALARALTVENEEQAQQATEIMGLCAQSIKNAENMRLEIVAPFKKITSMWDTRFRNIKAGYKEGREVAEEKLRNYRGNLREEAARKQHELAEAARLLQEAQEAVLETFGAPRGPGASTGDEEAAIALVEDARAELRAVPDVKSTLVGSTGVAQGRMVWKHRVTDPDAVPRAYCVPDEKLIREALRAGVQTIPGVHIYQEEDFAMRNF